MIKNNFSETLPYLPLSRLSEALDIPLPSLKARLYLAQKQGINLPLRKRIGKTFFYDAKAFCIWLYENSEALRQEPPKL